MTRGRARLAIRRNFPRYAGKHAATQRRSMAPAHECHRHVMISGSDYPCNMEDPDPVGTLERFRWIAAAIAAITVRDGRRILAIA